MHEELVKAIRQNTCHFDACGMCPKRNALCVDRMALQAADAIEELSHDHEKLAEDFNGAVELLRKRSKPRWIPVAERLPEQGWYLAYGPTIKTEVLHFNSAEEVWSSERYYNIEVTHWMPLPEPPKGE